MSNRFHTKFHRHNHHTRPTDAQGLYPDSASDPIASPEFPFQGDFHLSGNFVALSSVTVKGELNAPVVNFGDATIQNLTVLGTTSNFDTFVYVYSSVEVTNCGTGPAIKVTQTGTQNANAPIAYFSDGDDSDNKIIFDTKAQIGIGTELPAGLLHLQQNNFGETADILIDCAYNSSTLQFKTGIGQTSEIKFKSPYSTYANIVANTSLSSLAFGTNNSTRMTITSSGRIGFGIIPQNYDLSVYKNTSSALGGNSTMAVIGEGVPSYIVSRAIGSVPYIQLSRHNGTFESPTTVLNGDVLGRVQFVGRTTGNGVEAAMIEVAVTGTPSANSLPTAMKFSTSPTTPLGYVERMRITSEGKVGIGTSSPSGNLEIAGSSASSIETRILNSSTTGNSSAELYLITGLANSWVQHQVYNNGGNPYYYVAGGAGISGGSFNDMTNHYFRSESGNLRLSIGSANTTIYNGLAVKREDNTKGGNIGLARSYNDEIHWHMDVYGNTDTPRLRFTQQGIAERMTIMGDTGRVGIGTDAPATALDVVGQIRGTAVIGSLVANGIGSSQATIHLQRPTGAADQKTWELIQFDSAGTGRFGIRTVNDAYNIADEAFSAFRQTTGPGIDSLKFGTNFNTRMTITSAGFVGIGTTTPNEKLTVVGNISATGEQIHLNNPNGDSILKIRSETGLSILRLDHGPANLGAPRIAFQKDDRTYARIYGMDSVSAISFETSEVERMRIGGDGNTDFYGKLTVHGDLSSTGNQYFANTFFTTSSALSVVNTSPVGTQPALYVGQNGPADIASFYDIDQGIEVLHIGGANSIYPNVGIKTSAPNKTFTVNGEISANGIIWNSNGNSDLWNAVYSVVKAMSATWTGNGPLVTNTVGISASTSLSFTLSQSSTDIEILPISTAVTQITSFTNGVRGVTYTLTNKTPNAIKIYASPSVILRRGNAWRGSTTTLSGAWLNLPLSASCSVRADSSTFVSVW